MLVSLSGFETAFGIHCIRQFVEELVLYQKENYKVVLAEESDMLPRKNWAGLGVL